MASTSDRLTVLGIYPFWTFWAMGEGKGTPSFFLSPKGIVDAGHRMVLVMPCRDNPPGRDTYHGIERIRFPGGPESILENPDRGRFTRFFIRNWRYAQYQMAAYRAAIRTGREIRPDLVLAYGEYSAPVGRRVARKLGVPNVTRLFGTFLDRFTHSRIKLYYHYIQVLGFTTPADYLILCDDGSRADEVARTLGVDMSRVRFWRNGADHGLYQPDADPARLRVKLGLPPEGPLLFTVSRLHPEKHIERILRAMPEVLGRHPEARLLLVGDGPDRVNLTAESRRLGVGDAVVWTGGVDRDHLSNYLNAGDVFVAMSDRTNAANPLFEAMLCAKPCVALDTGGTSRVIENGVNGWLVPEAHPERLGRTLLDVLARPQAAGEAGRRAQAWARENIPTIEERQRMEVALIERAVREASG